jgi:Kef-type K+ transport system membrane component KefB
MVYRISSFILILGSMAAFSHFGLFSDINQPVPILVLGFMLLASYCVGFFLEKVGLPRITGYIFGGLFLGPYFLKFYLQESVEALFFLNSLALAFIAFCAGGELKLNNIRKRIKSLSCMLSGITLVVLIGVTIAVLGMSSFIPFMRGYPISVKIAIAAIFGVICTARSPSSAIAIITETKAKGPCTDTVLSITIAMDVVVIMLFAIIISLCQVMIVPSSPVNLLFIVHLLMEILLAFILGFFLGKGIVFLIRNVGVELPVIIAAMGFIVIKFCHLLGDYLHEAHDISLHLEPLLICMAAGFTVQNFSRHGNRFLHSMERVSLPIYVAFFAITGASMNMEVLRTGWLLGLVIVGSRTLMIFIGTYLSGKAAGEEPKLYKNAWLGFLTQAGVSLGLVAEVVRRFPEIGLHVQSILVAAITLNQIIGPAAFKFMLNKVGETKAGGVSE